jgi:hypothetical protein
VDVIKRPFSLWGDSEIVASECVMIIIRVLKAKVAARVGMAPESRARADLSAYPSMAAADANQGRRSFV